MKKMSLIIILLLSFIPGIIYAEDFSYSLVQSKINVNNDRTMHIIEDYNVYETDVVDSISRTLDKNMNVIGESNNIYGKISNIKSSGNISIKEINDNYKLTYKASEFESTIGIYKISYDYNLGKDNNIKKDIFYYNIMDNLENPVSNLIFEINMPKKIDVNNVEVFINNKKLKDDEIILTLDDNKKIIGFLGVTLDKKQTLSIKITLPDNYFKGGTNNTVYMNIWCLIPSIFAFLFMVSLFIRYGLGKQLKIKNEDKITEQYDPVELSYLYKGASMSDDIASILIYLANNGYLKIVENDDGYKLGKPNSFYFLKLKDYEKNNAVQEIIFNNIFKEADAVYLKDIEYLFSDHYEEANNIINSRQNYKTFFLGEFNIKKNIGIFITVIASLFLTFYPFYLLFNVGAIAIVATIAFAVMTYYLLKIPKGNKKNILSFVFFGLVALNIFCLYSKIALLNIYCIGIVLIILSVVLSERLTNRTKTGSKKLNEAYSLKNYLLNKDINSINKEYYYDMVPYAYVLGILNEWLQKGSGKITEGPSWYQMSPGKEKFKINEFNAFVRNVIYETSVAITRQSFLNHGKIEYKNDFETKLNS